MRHRIQSSECREKHLRQAKNTGKGKNTAQGAQQKVQHYQAARINVPVLDPIQNNPEERHHKDGVRQNLRHGIANERADVQTTTRSYENLVRVQEEVHQNEHHRNGIRFTENRHSPVELLLLIANYAEVPFCLFKRRPLIVGTLGNAGARLRYGLVCRFGSRVHGSS